MSEWEQREDGKRQAEVRAARAASIRVLRPLDGRREGRPEVDHAIHMIIDVGRSGEQARGGAFVPRSKYSSSRVASRDGCK